MQLFRRKREGKPNLFGLTQAFPVYPLGKRSRLASQVTHPRTAKNQKAILLLPRVVVVVVGMALVYRILVFIEIKLTKK